MNRLKKVTIEGFWANKTVNINLKKDTNFLIGINGSGKTTIINLIAATLNANFATLDRLQFKKIKIELENKIENKKKQTAFIEVEKIDKEMSPYSKIEFKIKNYKQSRPETFHLDELEEDRRLRHYPPHIYYRNHRRMPGGIIMQKNVNNALQDLINVTWLSVHRASTLRHDERNFDTAIDNKINELQNEFIKYFSQLNRKCADEAENFQKYIFESILDIEDASDYSTSENKLDLEKEKESLKEIFDNFKLDRDVSNKKIDSFFRLTKDAIQKIASGKGASMNEIAYFLGAIKINSVVQKWSELVEKQKEINNLRNVFLNVINNLFQHKNISINDKNELVVETENGDIFPLSKLSSGEKQLLIILGQSILQETKTHIYIADEPELSLHVEWQEKLVSSLKKLNPNSQIIFATHSPDIVGGFSSSVINVEKVIS